MSEEDKKDKRIKGLDEAGNKLMSVDEYAKIIADAEAKIEMARADAKADVIAQMKEDIVEYGITIGDLRGPATKQLMDKSKSWHYTPPKKKAK